MPQPIQAFFTVRVNLVFRCSLFLAPDRRQNFFYCDSLNGSLACLPSFSGPDIGMTSPTRSGAGSGSESDHDEVSASDLANSLVASKEAMNVLGSACMH